MSTWDTTVGVSGSAVTGFGSAQVLDRLTSIVMTPGSAATGLGSGQERDRPTKSVRTWVGSAHGELDRPEEKMLLDWICAWTSSLACRGGDFRSVPLVPDCASARGTTSATITCKYIGPVSGSVPLASDRSVPCLACLRSSLGWLWFGVLLCRETDAPLHPSPVSDCALRSVTRLL